MSVGLDTAGVLYGVPNEFRKLYVSEPMAALKIPITIQAGYGVLNMGTVIAANLSASGNLGKYVPYNPTTITGTEIAPGRAYLVANSGTTSPAVNVTINDSYKFSVGDDLIIMDDTTSAENLGAIVTIDRTTYTNYAVITATTNIGGVAFTTARFACVFVEAGDSSNNYSDAVGVLEKAVNTGTGVNAKGANATLIVSNCVLYNGMLTNMDSAARTDLSATLIGQNLIIK